VKSQHSYSLHSIEVQTLILISVTSSSHCVAHIMNVDRCESSHSMGKIRTKTVKRAGKKMVEAHFGKLSRDYYVNKRVVFENTVGTSKKLKNKISGYATHLMKRLARGPVRGISLKLQEEERERRLDFVPEVPWLQQKVQDGIQVDTCTHRMLKRIETGVPRAVRLEGAVPVKPIRPIRGGRGAPRGLGAGRGAAGRGAARGAAGRGRGGDRKQ
jgi:small subunit ribosomal protein S17e